MAVLVACLTVWTVSELRSSVLWASSVTAAALLVQSLSGSLQFAVSAVAVAGFLLLFAGPVEFGVPSEMVAGAGAFGEQRRARVFEWARLAEVDLVGLGVERSELNASWHPRIHVRSRRPAGWLLLSSEYATCDVAVFDAAVCHELGHARQRLAVDAVVFSVLRVALPLVMVVSFGRWALVAAVPAVLVVDAVSAWRDRRFELQADLFAASMVPASTVLLGMPEGNGSGPWLGRLFMRHPPLSSRAANLAPLVASPSVV